jgi:hypothetical protein
LLYSDVLSDLEVMEMMSNCKLESGGWLGRMRVEGKKEAYVSGNGLSVNMICVVMLRANKLLIMVLFKLNIGRAIARHSSSC